MADIVIAVDGTWCGPQTTTRTNTYLLACALSESCISDSKYYDETYGGYNAQKGDVHVLYMPGTGVDSEDISSYLVNCVLALDIRARCCGAYRFIMDHFQPEQKEGGNITRRASRIWLIGHSRGAHAVRSVAGMINNCGIVDKREKKLVDVDHMVKEVYSLYRSRDLKYHPNSTAMKDFREKHSLDVGSRPPVFFMGLLDTVGALGVPQLNQGASGVEYELYDPYVSFEVQHVWQGLAAHDRLTVFTPYFALRKNKNPPQKYASVGHSCQEVWFPGTHYDIGRQKFVFLRTVPGRWLEWGLERFNTLLNPWLLNVTFTPELANPPLKALAREMRACWAADTGSSVSISSSFLPDPDADPQEVYLSKWDKPANWREAFVESLRPLFRSYTINAYEEILKNSPLFRVPLLGPLLMTLVPIVLSDRVLPLYRPLKFHGGDKAFSKVCKDMKFESKSFETYQTFKVPHQGASGGGGQAAPGSSSPTAESAHASVRVSLPAAGAGAGAGSAAGGAGGKPEKAAAEAGDVALGEKDQLPKA